MRFPSPVYPPSSSSKLKKTVSTVSISVPVGKNLPYTLRHLPTSHPTLKQSTAPRRPRELWLRRDGRRICRRINTAFGPIHLSRACMFFIHAKTLFLDLSLPHSLPLSKSRGGLVISYSIALQSSVTYYK